MCCSFEEPVNDSGTRRGQVVLCNPHFWAIEIEILKRCVVWKRDRRRDSLVIRYTPRKLLIQICFFGKNDIVPIDGMISVETEPKPNQYTSMKSSDFCFPVYKIDSNVFRVYIQRYPTLSNVVKHFMLSYWQGYQVQRQNREDYRENWVIISNKTVRQ